MSLHGNRRRFAVLQEGWPVYPAFRTSFVILIVGFVVSAMTIVSAVACVMLGFDGIVGPALRVAKFLAVLTILPFMVSIALTYALHEKASAEDASTDDWPE